MAKKIKNENKFWWVYLVFGIIALIAGGNFCSYPLSALGAISNVTGLFLLFAGACNVVSCIIGRKENKFWWLYLILSVLMIAVGVSLFARISFALKFIWLLAGLSFVIEAVMEIFYAISLKKANSEGWLATLVLGIITGIAALSILADPIFGLRFVSIFVTIAVLCFGIKLILIAFHEKP